MRKALLYFVCLLLVGTVAQAWNVVNVNFQKDTLIQETKGGAAFGSGVTMTWNNYYRGTTSLINVRDSLNNVTTVDITANQPNAWDTGFFNGLTYGANIMNGYVHNNNTGFYNMIIAGLTPNASYDLYLYGHGDNEAQNTTFTISGVSKTSTIGVSGLTELTENAHYVVFRGVPADTSGQITVNWGNAGNYGAVNGLQIVRSALNTKATTPNPYNNEYIVDSPTALSWTNPLPLDGSSSITCTVYLGTNSNRANMDSVTLSPDVSTVQINTTNFLNFGSLQRGIDYYWIVDCVDATPWADPTDGQGDTWMFHNYLPDQDGFGGQATGGAGGAMVTVSTEADFLDYATRSDPYIVRVSGTIDLGDFGRVWVTSNKTIEGVDHNATIMGNIHIHTGVTNVIVRNLNITNRSYDPDADEGDDGITVWGASNVFITHCNIYDCSDGSLDITQNAENVTVSWCRFSYPNPSVPSHCFVSIGSDAHITFHHNWYDIGCDQRMPASSNGFVHMYNNYFSCTGNYYCSNARDNEQILSEYNYYDHVNSPIGISDGTNGLIRTVGNIYDTCTGTIHLGTDNVFTPTYAYTTDAVADVPEIVITGAGTILYGDMTGDEIVDGDDLAIFCGLWLDDSNSLAPYLDLNSDGQVSLYEFAEFAKNWLLIY